MKYGIAIAVGLAAAAGLWFYTRDGEESAPKETPSAEPEPAAEAI